MPQEGLRSAVFRSFVTCNDPKGVAECKTMRKSKQDTISNGLSHSPSKGKKIYFKTPGQETFEEVSKGAHNLNHVIDTYSNGGMRFNHHSKELAKDLLKGALDLQESLMVLSKLQEASHYMAVFQKKSKNEKNEKEIWIKKSKSGRYADYNYQKGFQKPTTSIDGSSGDCYDELRTVVRDSLTSQNLLLPNFQEKANFSKERTLDSMVDIPSTSSTQSSTMNYPNFTSPDTSCSSDSTKRSKGSNLIAKLMGLEEIKSSPKRLEIEKIASQRRPTFEIDMVNMKKPNICAYNDKGEKKLRDIIETMRYKGPFEGNSDERLRAYSNSCKSNDNKKVLIEDSPPIVIMKPTNEENNSQNLIRKTRIKDLNRGAIDFDEVCRKLRGEQTPMKKQGFINQKSSKLSSIDQKVRKKKVEQTNKLSEAPKKFGETKNLKSKSASKFRDEVQISSTEERRTGTMVISKKSTSPMVISKNKSPLSRKCGDRNKNGKIAKELVLDPLVETDASKREEKQIDQSCEDECNKASASNTTVGQLILKEEIDTPMDQIKDKLKNTKLETTVEKCFSKQIKENKLFLNNPSFLKHAEELVDIKTHPQFIELSPGISDSRILLDVVNELMLRKKLSTRNIHPPFLIPKALEISLTLAQLVDEIRKGLEDLSKYSENCEKKLVTETLYSVLEKDMLGGWESGWRYGYCFDDVEQVVNYIENSVFDELIEGMFTDSVNMYCIYCN